MLPRSSSGRNLPPHYVQSCPTDELGRHVLPGLDLSGLHLSDLELDSVVIEGQLRCVRTTFTDAVRIRAAQITEAEFGGAHFEAYVKFADVRVIGRMRFMGAVFERDVDVTGLTCGPLLALGRGDVHRIGGVGYSRYLRPVSAFTLHTVHLFDCCRIPGSYWQTLGFRASCPFAFRDEVPGAGHHRRTPALPGGGMRASSSNVNWSSSTARPATCTCW